MSALRFICLLHILCIANAAVLKRATDEFLKQQGTVVMHEPTGQFGDDDDGGDAFAKLSNAANHILKEAPGKGCSLGGYVACTENNVSVLVTKTPDGKNKRELQFGDECATETTVICKSKEKCEAQSPCGVCTCDFDESKELSTHYMQTMFQELGPWCTEEQSNVLMIGLGGGELPQYLLHHCPGMHVEAVELNGDVISIAKKFFGLQEAETKFADRFSIEQDDGFNAVSERAVTDGHEERYAYDAVLVDCFAGGGEVPESCRSRNFAAKVRDILKPKGVLLQNIWHYSKMRPQVEEEFKETKAAYSDVFAGALEDISVPMPPAIRWVDILKATKEP